MQSTGRIRLTLVESWAMSASRSCSVRRIGRRNRLMSLQRDRGSSSMRIQMMNRRMDFVWCIAFSSDGLSTWHFRNAARSDSCSLKDYEKNCSGPIGDDPHGRHRNRMRPDASITRTASTELDRARRIMAAASRPYRPRPVLWARRPGAEARPRRHVCICGSQNVRQEPRL